MTTMLTPTLLDFLQVQGYRFCLSKTICIDNEEIDNAILLKPLRSRPSLSRLPAKFDTYFALNQEPRVMADGVDHTLVMVEVAHIELKNYVGFFLNRTNALTA